MKIHSLIDTAGQPEKQFWRPMALFGGYRIILCCIFIASYFLLQESRVWANYNDTLYLSATIAYLVFSLLAIGLIILRTPGFQVQLSFQTLADIGFIIVLMYASGGIKSGLGLLLIVTIAAASLISQGRLALFYAAIASIGLLLEQSYQMLMWNEDFGDYSHAVMLSLSCFATAWLAYSFSKRISQNEILASQRGIDLENLAQVNQLITEEMGDGVLVVDPELVLRHRNRQADFLLGAQGGSRNNQPLAEYAPELASLLRHWLENRRGTNSAAIKLSIEQRALRLKLMPVGEDHRQGTVIFIEDWSQLQTQAQQLKLAALGRLTANIAHEIRNPLSAISHATQLLQEDESHDPASERMLQIISDNVQRMDQMIKDVLELNRRDRTRQQDIPLADFLREFHDQFYQVEKIPAQGFVLDTAESEPTIRFDHRHLHQILWNLCRNGWRHSRQDHGSLTLALRSDTANRHLQIEIQDDGNGISPAALPHLFEPFFTTESTGTGLGLYIARELCEANGATIEHVPAEHGCLFIIHLKSTDAA
ncbi:PAS domain-containing protein [Methylobacillus caricis]|uniref:sensor histidine kinase n=1 Tax=Methylobacillus caricis TaxID=1971611 RepID=UPI001CFFF82E|nr:ATP-binding protein [Methylobacillus caricis]MCB5188360.1 PAS domain-containing protein [Methylobacillus caricis]